VPLTDYRPVWQQSWSQDLLLHKTRRFVSSGGRSQYSLSPAYRGTAQAESTRVPGSVPRWSPIQALTGPGVWVTTLIESNALPLRHVGTSYLRAFARSGVGNWPTNPLGHNPFFAAVRGSVRARSRPHPVGRIGSGVRVSASFQKKSPPSSDLLQQKGGCDLEKFVRGEGGWPTSCVIWHLVNWVSSAGRSATQQIYQAPLLLMCTLVRPHHTDTATAPRRTVMQLVADIRRSPTSISRHSDLRHAPHVQHLGRPMLPSCLVHGYRTRCQPVWDTVTVWNNSSVC